MYGSLAIVGFVAGILFYVLYGRTSKQPVPVLDSVETTSSQREDEEAQIESEHTLTLRLRFRAGANFSGISGSDANAMRWDQSGYSAMMSLIDAGAEEAKYLCKTESTEYWDQAPSQDKINSMTEYLRDVSSLQDAFLHGTQIVFNCVGNAALNLAGVADSKCYPTRGQIILVKAPSVKVNVMRHGKDYETYIIPRPRSDGTVVLGGYLQPGDHFSQARPVETESILSRTIGLLRILGNEETEIIRVAVGLRPSRQGGARVELETTPEGNTVVHNYGAGGTGFQAGMGMAKDAVDLASDILVHLQAQSKL
ncbi:unnamed protein product [Aspergillus oryzae var. brunneus]|nr:unnamed protein product [Aspergillus oryzae var. brunneus]